MEQEYLTIWDNPGPSGPRLLNSFEELYICRYETDAQIMGLKLTHRGA